MPSRSTGIPRFLAALSPFSSGSTAGSSLRSSFSPASMSELASSLGHRIRAAIRALTAELPAARCIAIRARGPAPQDAEDRAAPASALVESVADHSSRRVDRLACAAHGSRVAEGRTPGPWRSGRTRGTARCPNGHPDCCARAAQAVHWTHARGPAGETHATRRGEDRREAQACAHVDALLVGDAGSRATELLDLQRLAGNRAVAQLVRTFDGNGTVRQHHVARAGRALLRRRQRQGAQRPGQAEEGVRLPPGRAVHDRERHPQGHLQGGRDHHDARHAGRSQRLPGTTGPRLPARRARPARAGARTSACGPTTAPPAAPFSVTACGRSALDEAVDTKIQQMQTDEHDQRSADAEKKSAAIDPFNQARSTSTASRPRALRRDSPRGSARCPRLRPLGRGTRTGTGAG